jgi:hypothetical protein
MFNRSGSRDKVATTVRGVDHNDPMILVSDAMAEESPDTREAELKAMLRRPTKW